MGVASNNNIKLLNCSGQLLVNIVACMANSNQDVDTKGFESFGLLSDTWNDVIKVGSISRIGYADCLWSDIANYANFYTFD